jgi:hypothetical protein
MLGEEEVLRAKINIFQSQKLLNNHYIAITC